MTGRRLLGAACVVALAAQVGLAGGFSYTSFNDGINVPLEPSHSQLLDDIYGGTFMSTGVGGVDFTNGTITASRVFDAGGGLPMLHLVTGGPSGVDQIWTDGTATVTAEAKFALFGQSFGWNGGGLGTTYNELLTDADVGGPPVTFMVTGDFLWGIDPTTPNTWWSMQSNNTDGAGDHLITYQISGLGVPETVWLLFWEDEEVTTSDLDFNDFVIEVRAIPEPATAMLLLMGGAAGLLRRRRR